MMLFIGKKISWGGKSPPLLYFIGIAVEEDGVTKRDAIERNTKSKPFGRFVRVVHIDIWHYGRTKGGGLKPLPLMLSGKQISWRRVSRRQLYLSGKHLKGMGDQNDTTSRTP